MGFPRPGRVTVRWSKGELDWLAAWGAGHLKGPAGGFMRLLLGGGSEQDAEKFAEELRRMGFDPTTFRAQIDKLPT